MLLFCAAAVTAHHHAEASGGYFSVSYPPSKEPDELQLEVSYNMWVPGDAQSLRAVIVHQHGCGFGANAAGETAAHDLHWQALAAKWDAVLLSPRYRQTEEGRENCELWMDPRKGSRGTFLRALEELAAQSGHPELGSVPWCLWGHSGGGYWASLMQTLDPQRVVAVWLRSGTAFAWWESGQTEKPALSEAVFGIPAMLNPGIRESTDGRPEGAWLGSASMFKAYRAKGAPIGFAADPLSGHDCGDSRYLAIPFFDACLELRLPGGAGSDQPLRKIDVEQGWLAELMGRTAHPWAGFKGKRDAAVWLPNERVAKAWMDYVATGATGDESPPPAPVCVALSQQADGSLEITWDATADFESGLGAFIIERDGKVIAQVPEKPAGRFGRPLFQILSYHDTPEPPLPEMRFVDRTAGPGAGHEYRVIAVNSAGLRSEPGIPTAP